MDASLAYVKRLFMERPPKDKQVYAHITTATNVDLMRAIINDVMNIVIEVNLKKANQPL